MELTVQGVLKSFLESTQKIPEEDIAEYNKVVKLMSLGDYKSALDIMEKLSKKYVFNTVFLKTLAACHQELENYYLAVITYQVAYSLSPEDNLDCLYYAGICLYKADELEKSRVMFESFLASDFSNEDFKKRAQLYVNKINKLAATTPTQPD